ncbi:MAG: hypothetical protein M1610_01235 [Nitrospirae bacterium]|nr:hypothetical protein [Nitrospirota bacterium]MDA8338035.1 hypothetical protein [Nitrospiraceae bacterium]
MIWRIICKTAVVVILIFAIAGCEKVDQPKKKILKIGELEVELADYFEISYEIWGNLRLDIPAIVHTPDGQFDTKASVYCDRRKYIISCLWTLGNEYESEICSRYSKKGLLDKKSTFDFQSIWNEYCVAAGRK